MPDGLGAVVISKHHHIFDQAFGLVGNLVVLAAKQGVPEVMQCRMNLNAFGVWHCVRVSAYGLEGSLVSCHLRY